MQLGAPVSPSGAPRLLTPTLIDAKQPLVSGIILDAILAMCGILLDAILARSRTVPADRPPAPWFSPPSAVLTASHRCSPSNGMSRSAATP
jgi:hypothetical protein